MKVVFLAVASVFTLPNSLVLTAGEPLKLPISYWQGEALLKSFSASYGVDSRIEPSVTVEEQKLLASAAQWMKKGEKKRALEVLKKSENATKSPALLYNQATIYLELGDEKKAIEVYLAAIKAYPSFRRAHKNLGLTYFRDEQFLLALTSLVKAVSLGDMSGSTLGMLGYCHLQNEHYASALQSYRLAQLTEPETIEWKAGVAQCLLEFGQDKEALLLIEEVVKDRPNEVSYQLLMANMLLQRGENVRAIAVLEWLGRQDKLSLEHVALLAQLHAQGGMIELAKPWFDKVREDLSAEIYPQYLMSLESVIRQGEWELAEGLLSVEIKSGKLSEDLLNKRDRLVSAVLIEQNKEGAKKLLEDLIKRDPLDGEALVLLAKVLLSEGETSVAEFYYRRAEKIEGSKYAALHGYGTMLVTLEKYEAAAEKFQLAQKIHPTPEQQKYIDALHRIARE